MLIYPPTTAHIPRAPQILKVDLERQAIVIKGNIPGKPGNLIEMTQAKILGTNW